MAAVSAYLNSVIKSLEYLWFVELYVSGTNKLGLSEILTINIKAGFIDEDTTHNLSMFFHHC